GLGFWLGGSVDGGRATGAPHARGRSGAIWGQAPGVTEMRDGRMGDRGGGGAESLVEPVRTSRMLPGDARLYDVGAVHSPRREAAVKLIRIEGKNLDQVKRSNIKAR